MSTTPGSGTPRSEELRLALVMNGGVSLAIWIGGVIHEINRFVGETHPVYQQLLELTATRARVDVISGTSAGGINGAALALACVYDTSLYSLRELWLSKGSLTDLLRNPGESAPSSLLRGDDYFLPALKEALSALVRNIKQPRPREQAPMDLSLTSTMLRGEPHTRLDDLGEGIEDVHHRAVFHFARSSEPDPFDKPVDIANRLALAARASASFPAAFEPRWFPATDFENVNTGEPGQYDRYLIDGGVLDNKPLRSALRAIFNMPPNGGVRRVLAYVVPDPSVTATAKSDQESEPPPIAEVALASLLGIPSAQSIADQLQEVEEHNYAVRRRRHTMGWLASNLAAADLATMATKLFGAYRERRIDGLLDFILERVEVKVGLLKAGGEAASTVAFGRHTRDWLKAFWRTTEKAEGAWAKRIPIDIDDMLSFDLATSPPSNWTSGLYSIEFVAGIMIDLLRRTQRLSYLKGYAKDATVEGIPIPMDNTGGEELFDWDLLDKTKRDQRRDFRQTGLNSDSDELSELWDKAAEIREDIRLARSKEKKELEVAANNLLQILQAEAVGTGQAADNLGLKNQNPLVDWLFECLKPCKQDQPAEARAQLALRIANVLLGLCELMKKLAEPKVNGLRPNKKILRADEEISCNELRRLYELLLADNLDANKLMRGLLQLEIVYYSMAGPSEIIDAAVELVQISGRGQSPWGGPATPGSKLTGMQLGHFGAFYRKSWRANDWMMGRLDGVSRIVRMALNPDRLHQLYGGRCIKVGNGECLAASEYVFQFIKALAVDSAPPSYRNLLGIHWKEQERALKSELAFLDHSGKRVPETMLQCATALIRRLHLEILCKELPEVANSAQDDSANGAALGKYGKNLVQRVRDERNPPWQSNIKNFLNKVIMNREMSGSEWISEWLRTPKPGALMSPESAARAFRDCPVGSETIDQEFGEDLMTRTAGQATIVAHAAAVGRHSGLGGMGGLLKILTLPVRFFYLLTTLVTQDSRTSVAIATTIVVSGFFFVLGAVLLGKPHSTLLAPLGVSMLIAWAFAAIVRRRWAIAALVLLALLVLIAPKPIYLGLILLGLAFAYCPAWFNAVLFSLIAVWWSTGQPPPADIGAAVCQNLQRLPLKLHCTVEGTAANAKAFLDMLALLMVVFTLAIFAYLSSRLRRLG